MITVQPRKNKRGLQQLSDAQKMEAITKVQKGETKAAVAREFGVPESTLRGWCKKAKLNGHCHSSISKSQPVSSTVSPLLIAPEVSKALLIDNSLIFRSQFFALSLADKLKI